MSKPKIPTHDRRGRKIPADPAHDLAMKRFVDNIDTDKFKYFLEDAGNDKYDIFLAMLGDPAYAKLPFATIARKANLTLQELQEVYSNGMRHLALLRMSTALPDIMDDVTVDARSTMETCPRCDGEAFLPGPDDVPKKCPSCRGSGTIRRIGDKHARDLVFESAKLTGQTGPLVAIQHNTFTGDSRMESMLKRTRSIVLEPRKDPVDNPEHAE